MEDRGGRERRREARIKIRAQVHGQVLATLDARLMDLSAVGALLEHVEPIRPGAACELLLQDEPEELCLPCRIVRSALIQPEGPAVSHQIRYHSGVEFVDPTPAQRRILEALMRRQRADGGGSSSSGLDVVLRF